MPRFRTVAVIVGAVIFAAAAIVGPPARPLSADAAPMPRPAAGKAPQPAPEPQPTARVSAPSPIPGWRPRP